MEKDRNKDSNKYQLLFNEAPIAYQSLDADGKILEVNDIWLQKMGYARNEVLGEWFGEFLPDHLKSLFKEKFAENKKRHDLIKDVTYPLVTKSGNVIYARYTARIKFDENEKFVRTHCVFEDVTEKMRAEKIQSLIHNILEIVVKTDSLNELLESLRNELSTAIEVNNFYVALYDEINDDLNFIFHHDERIRFKSHTAENTLTGYVIKTGKPLFADVETQKKLYNKGKIGKADKGTEAKIWIGVPLKTAEKTIGAVCVQSYENEAAYSLEDMELLEIVSDTIALAITRKQNEDALKENEEKFRTLYDNTAIGLYRTTPEGKIIMANPATIKLLGYDSFEKLSNRNLEQDGYHPSYNRGKFKKIMEENNEVSGLESVWKNSKGDFIYVRESARAVRDETGKIKYYDGVIEDITDKKEMELALKESEKRLSLALESAGLGLWDQNFKTGEVYRNENWSNMLGYELEEIEKKVDFFVDLIHPDDLPEFREQCRRAESGEDPKFGVEHRVKTKDGSWKWIYNWGRIVERDENGEPVRSIGTHLDITHLKETEQELRLHQEHTKLINSILRHDIASTFAVIKSALNIFRRNNDIKMLDEANAQIKKGISLINKMKRLEEYFSFSTKLTELQLADLIKEVASSYIYMKTTVKGDAKIFADDALSSVFDNLFANASKHGSADEIEVEIKNKENVCTIIFKDNGTGIPDKIKGRIFEEAFKSGKTGNTGLGLYIVKKTIDRYGGDIRVENNMPKGAKFIIELKCE
ncbi:MAG: PAS domain S-box protein [Candidatus Cloacimonetes bacterium]|nr:PAS domain S-box protein [Candidatus Cloacimonadota bacterium]MCF7867465.1 PAS domain S-box protein [Candidatus Cloacimonadota bacterium]MCF7882903.1 PAS domain S-box protein [Candidatus Cloacimonadota bacterium]